MSVVIGGYSISSPTAKKTLLAMALAVGLLACGKPDQLDPLVTATFGGPPATMSVKITNYRPQPGKAFQHLFVSNFSVKAKHAKLYKSTSRDGLFDELKIALNPSYGFLITGPETVVVGFADIVLFNLGIKSPQQSLMYCSSMQMDSTTNDALIYNDARFGGAQTFLGLRDCEKNYMALDPNKWNNSGDGIPDYLKVRCGLNPANHFDAFVSSAGDGVANIDHCKMNIPVDEDSRTDANQLFAYKYDIRTLDDGTGEFKVTNIPILEDGKDNFLAFYVTETDLSDRSMTFYSAFAEVKAGYTGKTLEFDYWALIGSPVTHLNQRIAVP